MIGIVSDTHDNLDAVRKAVRLFKDAGCSLIIHAGDFVAPFSAREFGQAGIPLRAVYGNCDGEKRGLADAIAPFGTIHEPPLVLRIENLSVAVVHKDADAREQAASGAYDVVIFGHTHKPEAGREGRTLLVNPGEAGGWVSGRKTIALLDPKDRSADIIPL